MLFLNHNTKQVFNTFHNPLHFDNKFNLIITAQQSILRLLFDFNFLLFKNIFKRTYKILRFRLKNAVDMKRATKHSWTLFLNLCDFSFLDFLPLLPLDFLINLIAHA